AAHVRAAIAGLHASGVAATAKHFPGHGNTSADSHRGLLRVDRPRAEIENVDLRPFRAAVASGVDVIMTAHIIYTALDPDHPSTMSSKILKDYLRGELGFSGLVITDSFNMDAIRKNFVPGDAAVAAINAGADMIMLAEERYGDDVGDYVQSQTQLLDRVEQAVMSGEISMARLNQAYGRVVALKKKYHLATRVPVNPERARAIVGSEADRAVERAAARASVNLVYDRKHLLPLKKGAPVYVVRLTTLDVATLIAGMRGIGPNYSNGYRDLVDALKGFGFDVREFAPGQTVPDGATVLAVSENYPLPGKSMDLEQQHARLAALQAAHKGPVIDAGLGAPYEAFQVSPDAYVSAVGSNRSNAEALAALLAGRVKSTSLLSVTPIKP
ncbi:MAG TPA: glycoside hydrolase family 3 N-terminal domain-containing protein, partial [Longimicrobiales bacterium]